MKYTKYPILDIHTWKIIELMFSEYGFRFVVDENQDGTGYWEVWLDEECVINGIVENNFFYDIITLARIEALQTAAMFLSVASNKRINTINTKSVINYT